MRAFMMLGSDIRKGRGPLNPLKHEFSETDI
jgi:hypothetical protein